MWSPLGEWLQPSSLGYAVTWEAVGGREGLAAGKLKSCSSAPQLSLLVVSSRK
jgi:hypothetical protein